MSRIAILAAASSLIFFNSSKVAVFLLCVSLYFSNVIEGSIVSILIVSELVTSFPAASKALTWILSSSLRFVIVP